MNSHRATLKALSAKSVDVSRYTLSLCPCCREENATLENTDPVQLFWKADKKSIHQIDDGNSTKSFSFGMFYSMYRINKCVHCGFVVTFEIFSVVVIEVTYAFLFCCSQTAFSLLKKQPISYIRILRSLWLFPPLKDTMVCNEN